MVTDGKTLYYFAVTRLLLILRGITSNKKNVYCLNCCQSFRTENKDGSHEKVSGDHYRLKKMIYFNTIIDKNQQNYHW